MSKKHTRLPLHPSALTIFTILTLLLSWPLPVRMVSWVPGVAQWAFDESTFLWNIWYFKHSLIDNLSTPLHSDLIYYPLGIDLILYTYNFFNVLIAQPLHAAIGLVFASNVTILLSTVLSGYGTFLLVRYLLIRDQRAEIRDWDASKSPIPNAQPPRLQSGNALRRRRRHRLCLRLQPGDLRHVGPLRHGHDPVDPLLRPVPAA